MAADYDECEAGAAEEEGQLDLPENGVQKRSRTASMYFYRHHYLSIIQEEEESADHQQAATPASSRRAVCRLYFFDIPLNWNEFSLNLFDGQVKGKTQFSARQTCNFPAPRNPEPVYFGERPRKLKTGKTYPDQKLWSKNIL